MPTRQHLPIRLIQTITALDLLTTLIRHVTLYCSTDPKLAFGLLSHRRLVTEDPETLVPTARFKRAVPATVAGYSVRPSALVTGSLGEPRHGMAKTARAVGRHSHYKRSADYYGVDAQRLRRHHVYGTEQTPSRCVSASSPRRSTQPPPQYARRPLLGERIGFTARWSNARPLGNQHGCQVTCRSPWWVEPRRAMPSDEVCRPGPRANCPAPTGATARPTGPL